MPPRMIGELSLFAVEIDSWFHWLGLNHHLLDFTYQGVIINGAVLLYHGHLVLCLSHVYVSRSSWFSRSDINDRQCLRIN